MKKNLFVCKWKIKVLMFRTFDLTLPRLILLNNYQNLKECTNVLCHSTLWSTNVLILCHSGQFYFPTARWKSFWRIISILEATFTRTFSVLLKTSCKDQILADSRYPQMEKHLPPLFWNTSLLSHPGYNQTTFIMLLSFSFPMLPGFLNAYPYF